MTIIRRPTVFSLVGEGLRRRACDHRPMTHTPDLALTLRLQPHPEGGWYRETWRSPVTVTLPDGRERATATLIWFLLPAGESSRWHRVSSDEIWLAHTGIVEVELGGAGSAPDGTTTHLVGTSPAEQSQVLVPARVWQRTLPRAEDALVSCLVSPGFDFADFELTD